MKLLSIAILAVLCTRAHGELRPQLQADLGLSVVAVGYEHPVGAHTAVMVGGGLFGTYFLPWFSRGDNVVGGVGDLRVTWFHREDGHGLYVTPYLRAGYASGSDETTKVDGAGVALTGGIFIGYAFALSDRLDLRIGGGAQYIYVGGDHDVGASTPFIALDTALGWRL